MRIDNAYVITIVLGFKKQKQVFFPGLLYVKIFFIEMIDDYASRKAMVAVRFGKIT